MLLENPRKRKRGRPRKSTGGRMLGGLKMPTMRSPFFGISLMEAAGAAGGLAAVTMIPTMVIRTATTTGMKLAKVAVAFATAVLIGSLARGVVGADAAKAVTYGGIAGASAQTLGAFTTFKIGGGNIARQIATSTLVSPASRREGEDVAVIQP